jgi:hypothetical protein
MPRFDRNQGQLFSLAQLSFKRFAVSPGRPGPADTDGGELRVSNYLLWQIAYAELWVTPTLWPDFDKAHLVQAILDYQKRVQSSAALNRPGNGEEASLFRSSLVQSLTPVKAGFHGDRALDDANRDRDRLIGLARAHPWRDRETQILLSGWGREGTTAMARRPLLCLKLPHDADSRPRRTDL